MALKSLLRGRPRGQFEMLWLNWPGSPTNPELAVSLDKLSSPIIPPAHCKPMAGQGQSLASRLQPTPRRIALPWGEVLPRPLLYWRQTCQAQLHRLQRSLG